MKVKVREACSVTDDVPMQLQEFQARVAELTRDFAPPDPASLMLLLTEEVGELARAIRKVGGPRWGHPQEVPGSAHGVAAELGDVLFLAARIAQLHGTDLQQAAALVLDKIATRQTAALGSVQACAPD